MSKLVGERLPLSMLSKGLLHADHLLPSAGGVAVLHSETEVRERPLRS